MPNAIQNDPPLPPLPLFFESPPSSLLKDSKALPQSRNPLINRTRRHSRLQAKEPRKMCPQTFKRSTWSCRRSCSIRSATATAPSPRHCIQWDGVSLAGMLGGAVDSLCGIIRCPHPSCTIRRRQLGQSCCGEICNHCKMQRLPKVCAHGSIYAISIIPSVRAAPIVSLQISHTNASPVSTRTGFGADLKFHIMMYECTIIPPYKNYQKCKKSVKAGLIPNPKHKKRL